MRSYQPGEREHHQQVEQTGHDIGGKGGEGTGADVVARLGQFGQGDVGQDGGLLDQGDELVAHRRQGGLGRLGQDDVEHRLNAGEAMD